MNDLKPVQSSDLTLPNACVMCWLVGYTQVRHNISVPYHFKRGIAYPQVRSKSSLNHYRHWKRMVIRNEYPGNEYPGNESFTIDCFFEDTHTNSLVRARATVPDTDLENGFN